MKKLVALLCLLSSTYVVTLTGCSSKREEVAVATPQTAPDAPQDVDDSNSSDSTSMSDGGGDDSGALADDSSSEVDETAVEEDATMSDEPVEDATMAESDGVMADEDGAGQPVVRSKPKNLREQAEQAFGDGYEKAAYRLIQAHMLASTSDASELLSHYRWSPSRRQPQLGVRIAIGVELNSPSDLKDFKPIGSLHGFFTKRKTSSKNRSGPVDDEPAELDASTALAATISKERILQKYTGLMGDVLVDHVRTAHSEGKWAPIFQTLTGVVRSALQFHGGGDGIDDGSSGGDDGSGNIMASTASSELSTRIDGAEAKYISVGPILSYIGQDTTAELLEQAKEGQFDALIVFDVDVTVNTKLRLIYNSCRAKMLSLDDGKSLAASKLLKNTEAQKEIDKSGRSYVVTAMQPILAKLDEIVAIQDIPAAITPEVIKTKRLEKLMSDETRGKLDSVTEIRLWREKSMLEDADVLSAYETILGPADGKTLAFGTEAERLVVVKKLLASP